MTIHIHLKWVFWLIALLAACVVASHCQELPDAPSSNEKAPALKGAFSTSLLSPTRLPATTVLQGWARRNRYWLGGFLALQAGDWAATERGFQAGNWHERNPLVPGSTAGRAIYFPLTAGAVVGASWLVDRLGHRRLATWILQGAMGVEAQANVRSWGRI